jgi:hypothetical protein
MIAGTNVKIPAHYHGAIVGISISIMGLYYVYCYRENIYTATYSNGLLQLFLPKSEHGNHPINTKIPSISLSLVFIGQVTHITGLALAGGYGVMRKTPGGIMSLEVKFYMGLMGMGGLIAIIGGLIFVANCVKRMYMSAQGAQGRREEWL